MSELFADRSLAASIGLVLLALLPLSLVTLTSFAKVSVVFSALRSALGAPDVPSAFVITGLSLALTVYVMAPVFSGVEARLFAPGHKGGETPSELLDAVREPLKVFLGKNAGQAEKKLFLDLAKERGVSASESDVSVLWASFALSELKRAFELAFFLFLPFLVLDLIVGQTLLALGLHGLSAPSVALPFKLLLFVSVDGFVLVSRALVLGYS